MYMGIVLSGSLVPRPSIAGGGGGGGGGGGVYVYIPRRTVMNDE